MNDYNKYKLLIFDADGTLRRCTVPNQPTPNREGEWELIPGVRETLSNFDWTRVGFGVASNQAGVALGYLSEDQAYDLLAQMVIDATGVMPGEGNIQMCIHALDAGCLCRKPMPGMLLALMNLYRVAISDTLYVGDMESDEQAARNAGCDFAWAHEFFGRGQPPK